MKVDLTEQQGRTLAAAARFGVRLAREYKIEITGVDSIADEGEALKACDKIDAALVAAGMAARG